MIVFYFLTGFLAAVLAALPPGGANVAMVQSVVNKSLRHGLYLALGASIGEVIIAYLGLHFTMSLTAYFENNEWIQIVFFLLFIVLGVLLLVRKWITPYLPEKPSLQFSSSEILKGFFLAALNPPVVIFWLLAFSIIQSFFLELTDMSSPLRLTLFFSGVFLGKFLVLYGYGLWGQKIDQKPGDTKAKLYSYIGIGLFVLGCVQGARYFFYS